MLGVDASGLDEVDRNLMIALLDKYAGGPVGLGTLAAVLSEEEDAIEEIYEPYLMQIGMIDRTRRGWGTWSERRGDMESPLHRVPKRQEIGSIRGTSGRVELRLLALGFFPDAGVLEGDQAFRESFVF